MAVDTAPNDRLIKPLRDVLVETLYRAGFPAGSQVSDGPVIDRDGVAVAAVYVDNANPAVLNRSTERMAGGKLTFRWRDSQNRRWARLLRSRLVLSFLVEFTTPSVASTIDILLNFVAHLPRDARDAHFFTSYSDANTPPAERVPAAEQGNVFEITPLQPIFPTVRTSTARSYKASVIVRFDGGICVDEVDGVRVAVKIGIPEMET